MNQSERGSENAQAINERNEQDGKTVPEAVSNGEVAGGDVHDVPGGAYNVPPGAADEVSSEEAIEEAQQPTNPER